MPEKRFIVDGLTITENSSKGRKYLLEHQGGVNALCNRINGLFDKFKRLEKENQELKKQLKIEETDKKRLMSYLMRYKGFSFDEIVDDYFNEPYYDNWWEDGFYEFCWKEYIEEKELSE